MKRLLTLLALIMALTVILAACGGKNPTPPGNSGGNIENGDNSENGGNEEITYSQGLAFTSNGDGTCYVSGIGDCTDTNVIIPPSSPEGDKVTKIGDEALRDCDNITNVIIPQSVTSIGEYAFCDCDSLTEIVLPDSVTSIGDEAFYHSAYYYAESNWKNGVLYIDNHLIEAKDNVSGKYTIKDGTVTIASHAFDDCNSLTGIIIPASVINICESAFSWSRSLSSITFAEGSRLKTIGEASFCSCKALTRIAIPASVTLVEKDAFEYCDALQNIIIPDNNKIENIGYGAFNETAYYKNESNWDSGVLYIGNILIETKYTVSGNYTIKDGTQKILHQAFYNCDTITGITIPASVTYIGNSVLFSCNSLIEIKVAEGNKKYKDIDGNLYSYDGSTLIQYAIGKSSNHFEIPDGVTSISVDAFRGCTNLTSLTIPKSLNVIPPCSLADCISLTEIKLAEESAHLNVIDGELYTNDGMPLSSHTLNGLAMDSKKFKELYVDADTGAILSTTPGVQYFGNLQPTECNTVIDGYTECECCNYLVQIQIYVVHEPDDNGECTICGESVAVE